MKRKMVTVAAALVLAGVFAFAACSPNGADGKGENMDEEKEFTGNAFNFELTDTNGDTYKLSDLQGKKVYIKFWASWCSICLAGLEEFKELDAEYKDASDVLILTMVAPGTSGEMTLDKFKQWYDSQGFEFVTLLNEGGSVMREYGIRGFPTSVFIDTEGNIAATRIGHVDNDTIRNTISEMS